MKRLTWLAAIALLVGCHSRPAGTPQPAPRFDGEITSSGGELVTVEKNPWFVGAAPVRYCVAVTGDFSLAEGRARALVREAFSEWAETIRALKPVPLRVPLADGETMSGDQGF